MTVKLHLQLYWNLTSKHDGQCDTDLQYVYKKANNFLIARIEVNQALRPYIWDCNTFYHSQL